MQTPLNIRFHHMDRSAAIEAKLREKIEKFDSFYNDFISCSITVECINPKKLNGSLYSIHININRPSNICITTKHEHEDINVALKEAIHSITMQLEENKDRAHDKIKHHPQILHGKIVRLIKDQLFGFIINEHYDDIPESSLINSIKPIENEYYFSAKNYKGNFDGLNIGDKVKFIEFIGDDGLQAHKVCLHES